MVKRILSVHGPCGVGKSSLTEGLKAMLPGYEYVSTGAIARKIAIDEYKYPKDAFNEFVKFARTEEFTKNNGGVSYDEMLDNKLKQIGEDGDRIILDSRLGYLFVQNSFKINLFCPVIVRAQRIVNDPKRPEYGFSLEQVKDFLIERDEIDDRTYKNLYGTDINNPANFDEMYDTSLPKHAHPFLQSIVVNGYFSYLKKAGVKL